MDGWIERERERDREIGTWYWEKARGLTLSMMAMPSLSKFSIDWYISPCCGL